MSQQEKSVTPQEVRSFLSQTFFRGKRHGSDKELAYWKGRHESYLHLICLLESNFFGNSTATSEFLETVWRDPDWEEEEDEDEEEEEDEEG